MSYQLEAAERSIVRATETACNKAILSLVADWSYAGIASDVQDDNLLRELRQLELLRGSVRASVVEAFNRATGNW